MYELPPILNGSAESQLRALRDYLVRLSQTLPTETTQPAAAQTGAVSPQLAAARAVDSNPTGSGQVTPSNYPRLRALIEKTAGEIYSHVDAINRQLRADYVARSELGEFEERVTAGMEATARGVVEDYDYDARLTASDARAGRIEEHLRSLSGQIRRGLITDPETGEQVLGLSLIHI